MINLEDNFNKACKEMYICFKNIDNTMYEKFQMNY